MMSPWQLFPISHWFPVCRQISVFYRLQLAGNMKGKPMHTHHKKVSLLKIGFLVLLVVISLQMRCKKSPLLIAKNHYLGTHYRVRVFGSGPRTPSQFFWECPPLSRVHVQSSIANNLGECWMSKNYYRTFFTQFSCVWFGCS